MDSASRGQGAAMRASPDTCSVATCVEQDDPQHPMTDSNEHPVEARQPRVSLLLVEDDDEIRASLEDVLTDFGYDVRSEPSADAALPTLHQHLPDVIVSDVRMPGLSGIDFCKRMTGDGPHVPV